MKRNIKKLLITFALCATSVFAVMASGCSFLDGWKTKIDQLECEHEWSDGDVTKAATCETSGEKTLTCTLCELETTEEVQALGHSYDKGKETKAATCESDGEKTYTCATCKKTKTETVAALGHAYEDGTCTTCGKSENAIVINFKISDMSQQAESGMTWSEWVASDYNTTGYFIHNDWVLLLLTDGEILVVKDGDEKVSSTAVITADTVYVIQSANE